MKIGIITFWNSNDNYGQVLQCYALQWYLRALGHFPFLIRYDYTSDVCRNTGKSNSNINRPFNQVLKSKLKQFAKTLLKKFIWKKTNHNFKSRNFDIFRQSNMQTTPKVYYSLKELQQNPPEADIYIAGSDQIWNVNPIQWRHTAFFLNFGNDEVKKISYAASIARKDYPYEWIPILSSELTRFNEVSVRELESVDICRQCGINASLVLDPTLIVAKEAYTTYLTRTKRIKQLYLYIINISSAEELRIEEVMRAKGELSIKATVSSGYLPATKFIQNMEYEDSTVEEWLNNIATSQYVITSSFHGVIFCIIFHTPFLFIPLRGQFSGGNNRVSSILSQLGIIERYLNENDDIEMKLYQSINWEKVDEKLEILRKTSTEWLKNAIS